MIQFTQQEILHFREKIKQDDSVIKRLLQETEEVRTHPLQIPHAGIARWALYYYCDDCSVSLEYKLEKPFEHRCPVCGKVYTGEPYDGAWWNETMVRNCDAAYQCGLLYICTEDLQYARLTRDVLMEYAKYYPGYEVHGNIPYNGPGKAKEQTLCEAVFIRTLATAYDLVEDTLTAEEQDYIKERLIRCGAEFLKEHRHNQLHNHEVIINAAIGVAGLILNDEDLIDFAVYKPYGLLYQLENGVLEDGMWFECSLAYNYYALQNFYGYERFAVHTKHSHIHHPNYSKMVHVALKFLKPDYNFPMINDSMFMHTSLNEYSLYEFSYKMFPTPELLWVLNKVYENSPRNTEEAFFYGVDTLGSAPDMKLEDYHNENGSGVTIVRGTDQQYLLIRHGLYGGEHDHYDRLGVSYYYNNVPVSADFGTTGYGAKYHYAYFKNTGTHNTVVIDEENQAPSAAHVLDYRKDAEGTYVDAQVQWTNDYKMPDSFTICQWSDEAYKDVTMRRRILKTDDYWIDIFNVDGVKDKTIDWVMHFAGKMVSGGSGEAMDQPLSVKQPFCHLHLLKRVPAEGQTLCTTYENSNVTTKVYSLLDDGQLLYAEGPSNPTTTKEQFLVHRIKGTQAVFVNVICSSFSDREKVQQVRLFKTEDTIIIKINCNGKWMEYSYPIN